MAPEIGVNKPLRTFLDTADGRMDIFPLTVVHTVPRSNYWYHITYNPVSATKTSVRCDVYSAKGFESPHMDKETKENLEQELMRRIQDLEEKHRKMTTFGYDLVSTSREYTLPRSLMTCNY
jgi:hypothetical protein